MNVDGVIGAVLFAKLASDAGLDIHMNDLENALHILTFSHNQTIGNGTPIDTILTSRASISLDQGFELGLHRLGRLFWSLSWSRTSLRLDG